MIRQIGWEAEQHLDWLDLVRALEAGHLLAPAQTDDRILERGPDTFLNRMAWIDGLGVLVKSATIFPGNTAQGLPSIDGSVALFEDGTGTLSAMLDFGLVTKWKTAADSLLSAIRLAPSKVDEILVVGAGVVAKSVLEAYSAYYANANFAIWNRDAQKAEALAKDGVRLVTDLPDAAGQADIIVTCTMSKSPVVEGAWLSPGTHLDLIGAYRPDMREVDDTAIRRAEVFVDFRETTLGTVGEIDLPIQSGALSSDDIRADFYDIAAGKFVRSDPQAITMAKNGGGAHLDLMTAAYIRGALAGC